MNSVTWSEGRLGYNIIHSCKLVEIIQLTNELHELRSLVFFSHEVVKDVDVSENSGFSHQIIHFNRRFHDFHQPVWGKHPYFWISTHV